MFRRSLLKAAALAAAALLAAPAAWATQTNPVYDPQGNPIEVPFVPLDEPTGPSLTERQAIRLVLRYPKVADWVDRYAGAHDTVETLRDREGDVQANSHAYRLDLYKELLQHLRKVAEIWETLEKEALMRDEASVAG